MAATQGAGLSWLVFALSTVLCWGFYGILLHSGQVSMNDPSLGRYKAFLLVGVAYFVTAVLAPLLLLIRNGATWNFPAQGILWSFLAGIVGAAGAFCVLLAFGAGGSPSVVMAIVFYIFAKEDPVRIAQRKTGAKPVSAAKQLEPLKDIRLIFEGKNFSQFFTNEGKCNYPAHLLKSLQITQPRVPRTVVLHSNLSFITGVLKFLAIVKLSTLFWQRIPLADFEQTSSSIPVLLLTPALMISGVWLILQRVPR